MINRHFLPGEKLPTPHSVTELCLYFEDSLIPNFSQLLQQGFVVKAQVGGSVKDLLCRQFGLDPQYLEKRIQTLFLNGKPVDDVDSAIVHEGSTLALSGAMPGLVGAILRRGGYYAPMRSHFSHGAKAKTKTLQKGFVNVKIFNLLLKDLGPTFLKRGIWINGKSLEDFIKKQSGGFWGDCKLVRVNGDTVGLDKLAEMNWPDTQIFLQLKSP